MNEGTNDLISITPRHFPEVAFKEPNAQAGPGTRLNKPLAPKPDHTKQSQRFQSGSPTCFLAHVPSACHQLTSEEGLRSGLCLLVNLTSHFRQDLHPISPITLEQNTPIQGNFTTINSWKLLFWITVIVSHTASYAKPVVKLGF